MGKTQKFVLFHENSWKHSAQTIEAWKHFNRFLPDFIQTYVTAGASAEYEDKQICNFGMLQRDTTL